MLSPIGAAAAGQAQHHAGECAASARRGPYPSRGISGQRRHRLRGQPERRDDEFDARFGRVASLKSALPVVGRCMPGRVAPHFGLGDGSSGVGEGAALRTWKAPWESSMTVTVCS